jgi:hypothetical protein
VVGEIGLDVADSPAVPGLLADEEAAEGLAEPPSPLNI